jgi:hypothetical protein
VGRQDGVEPRHNSSTAIGSTLWAKPRLLVLALLLLLAWLTKVGRKILKGRKKKRERKRGKDQWRRTT